MKINEAQYEKIGKILPKQRGNIKLNNIDFINALLYICENGCKWRALPKEYGNWHTIYVRFNRWAKNGVLERLFLELQAQELLSLETLCLDSTIIKVHPDGCGALKKAENSQ